jgi:hypothetical protein
LGGLALAFAISARPVVAIVLGLLVVWGGHEYGGWSPFEVLEFKQQSANHHSIATTIETN